MVQAEKQYRYTVSSIRIHSWSSTKPVNIQGSLLRLKGLVARWSCLLHPWTSSISLLGQAYKTG